MIINNLSGIKTQLWDTQKNIEEDVKLAQKKEELEKETKENKEILSGKYWPNKKSKYLDFHCTSCHIKFVPINFCKWRISSRYNFSS